MVAAVSYVLFVFIDYIRQFRNRLIIDVHDNFLLLLIFVIFNVLIHKVQLSFQILLSLNQLLFLMVEPISLGVVAKLGVGLAGLSARSLDFREVGLLLQYSAR